MGKFGLNTDCSKTKAVVLYDTTDWKGIGGSCFTQQKRGTLINNIIFDYYFLEQKLRVVYISFLVTRKLSSVCVSSEALNGRKL